jgi:choline-sulfatase
MVKDLAITAKRHTAYFCIEARFAVPMIVKLPGQQYQDRRESSLVRTIDLLPSILKMLGISSSGTAFDGASSLFDFSNRNKTQIIALAETFYPLEFGWAPLFSAISQEAQYIDAPRPEMYDLGADPDETTNTYAPWSSAVQNLRSELAAYLSAAKRTPAETGKTAAVSGKTLKELAALGYLPSIAGTTTAIAPSLLPDPKDRIELYNLVQDAALAREDGNVAEARALLKKVLAIAREFSFARTELARLEAIERQLSEPAKKK